MFSDGGCLECGGGLICMCRLILPDFILKILLNQRVNSWPAQQNYKVLLAMVGEDSDGGHVYSRSHGQNVSSNNNSFQTQSKVFLQNMKKLYFC